MSENHPLYGIFIENLSNCIFEWDTGDYAALKSAKASELKKQGVKAPTNAAIEKAITKKEFMKPTSRRFHPCSKIWINSTKDSSRTNQSPNQKRAGDLAEQGHTSQNN